MKLNLQGTQQFYWTAVHPSGYKIETQKNENGEIYRKILAINPHEAVSKKKVDLENLYIVINEFQKNGHQSDEILLGLVNTYGLLNSTDRFLKENADFMSIAFQHYENFMSETASGIETIKPTLTEEKLNLQSAKEEDLESWRFLLNTSLLSFAPTEIGNWARDFINRNILAMYSIPYIDQQNNLSIYPSSLGGAILFFAYSKNLAETKECMNCSKPFIDSSRTNNQKFCSERCRVSNYRKNKITQTIDKLNKNMKQIFLD